MRLRANPIDAVFLKYDRIARLEDIEPRPDRVTRSVKIDRRRSHGERMTPYAAFLLKNLPILDDADTISGSLAMPTGTSWLG